MNCEICNFKNPKGTVTAIILQDNKLLLLKRTEKPYKGMWDLPGGFMENMESPESAMARELKEELGVSNPELTFIQTIPGTHEWKKEIIPIISHFYLVDIGNEKIKLSDEHSEFTWKSLKNINWIEIACDSNRDMVYWIANKFLFDLDRVKELTYQLDPNAEVKEQNLYKAQINGFCHKVYDEEKLVGMGWIFLRQTMLRKQAVIEDMIVDETYRGRGLGGSILNQLLNWAKNEKVEMVELTTNPKRVSAHALYEKFGFKIHETDHMLLKL